MAGGEA
ncbi:hypothetical protein YPPY36_5007, partial [Yersinia pestis PY-36]